MIVLHLYFDIDEEDEINKAMDDGYTIQQYVSYGYEHKLHFTPHVKYEPVKCTSIYVVMMKLGVN